ncbi:MAG TPA: SDR family oxidoreductase [Stellaceae bacterium]|nr:SDR family oxidoreductase [Stellaceae bacterium]
MIAVVTGAGAGVGRATAVELARRGCDVALLARNRARLETVASEIRECGVSALPLPTDVADPDAVEAAAATVEAELGAIDIWVNVAMATIFAPLSQITPNEFRRATEVTYLGQVYGTMTALRWMRQRDRGAIVNVGSALAYRAIPLQSAYCGAKFAIRGFTDSVRTELIHDGSAIKLVMVHLPAVNTPQFDWALNKMGKRAQPVPPIYQPEVPARAIAAAALNPDRREYWVGASTVMAITGNKIAPGALDHYLAKNGYSSQLTDEATPANAPNNLFETVDGDYGAHGRFDDKARSTSLQALVDRHRGATAIGILGLCCLGFAVFSALARGTASSPHQAKGAPPSPQEGAVDGSLPAQHAVAGTAV